MLFALLWKFDRKDSHAISGLRRSSHCQVFRRSERDFVNSRCNPVTVWEERRRIKFQAHPSFASAGDIFVRKMQIVIANWKYACLPHENAGVWIDRYLPQEVLPRDSRLLLFQKSLSWSCQTWDHVHIVDNKLRARYSSYRFMIL